MSQTSETIAREIKHILADKGLSTISPSPDDTLTGSLQLDSLDLAVLVVRLEQKLGHDPFRKGRQAVPTFGELVAVYEETNGDRAC